MVWLHTGFRVFNEERLKTKGSVMKIKKVKETTNHTNSTNKVKRFVIFHVQDNYIINTFVIFVLFVVKKGWGL